MSVGRVLLLIEIQIETVTVSGTGVEIEWWLLYAISSTMIFQVIYKNNNNKHSNRKNKYKYRIITGFFLKKKVCMYICRMSGRAFHFKSECSLKRAPTVEKYLRDEKSDAN